MLCVISIVDNCLQTASPVAFKVKTTAPRVRDDLIFDEYINSYHYQSYCVRPNAGRIEPSQTIDVQGQFGL